MSDFLDTLRARGFVQQTTDEATLRELFATGERVTAYVGVDPTADSCHVGHLLPVMALVHLQRAGHRPVLLVGGGTARIGDPSGKTEMRRLLDEERIDANVVAVRDQLSRYLDLAPVGQTESEGSTGLALDNAQWILPLHYIEFLRDVGRHFSVNRMLAQDSVRLRLESDAGLSFLEFNYSLLQAYDYLVLARRTGCRLQMGGSDQWGNIVAGIDLVRRVDGIATHAITFPLVTTAGGQKMGKTEQGAIWLDPRRTSPYDYYQYWVNCADADVGRFLRFFTLLPVEEIEELERLEGADIRRAKHTLAFETTKLTHGEEEARKAQETAGRLFSAGGQASVTLRVSGTATVTPSKDITHELPRARLEAGVPAPVLFHECGLCDSRSAARRLARQGGLYVHGEPAGEDRVITLDDLRDGVIALRAGKKRHRQIVVDDAG